MKDQFSHISGPCLLVDRKKLIQNIQIVIDKCEKSGVILRPHMKTAQSSTVAEIFKTRLIEKITVSNIAMADYFIRCGWKDVTLAIPINVRDIDHINKIAKKARFSILTDSLDSIKKLGEGLTESLWVWIEIDTGHGRTGIAYKDSARIKETLDYIEQHPMMQAQGFLGHSGNTYSASSTDEIKKIYKDSVIALQGLKKEFGTEYLTSLGDTPGVCLSESLSGVDEIRAGNFMYFDLFQNQLGACKTDDISVVAACPVISIQKQRKEVIIHGGAVHLSKEALKVGNKSIYGKVVRLEANGWKSPIEGAYVKGLSQEHGILVFENGVPDDIEIGGLLGILPVHSCLTANLLRNPTYLDGGSLNMMPNYSEWAYQ